MAVKITSVLKNSVAAKAKIRANDTLLKINNSLFLLVEASTSEGQSTANNIKHLVNSNNDKR